MPRITLSRAQPGQKLTRPIVTSSGVVMVQAGAELTATLIDRLRGMGIDTVVVASGDEPSTARRPLHERLAELDERFTGHEQDPWMMQLKDIVARQLAAGPGDADA
jgi:hypothetical protein